MQTENSTPVVENTTDTTCNGWTNYATWRVNLEIVDEYMNDITSYNDEALANDYGDGTFFSQTIDLADHLAEYVESIIDDQANPETLANGYATAFIHQVNWLEIAETYVHDNPTLITEKISCR